MWYTGGVPRQPAPRTPASVDVLTSIRLPSAMVERVDRLLPALNRDPALTALGPVTRAAALRLAIVDGLSRLESKYRKDGAR